MGDKETFKLPLFFQGKGCNPEIISRLILLAQSWASSQATAQKRERQIQFVNNNVDSKRHQWFYYDLDYRNYCTSKGYHDEPHDSSEK